MSEAVMYNFSGSKQSLEPHPLFSVWWVTTQSQDEAAAWEGSEEDTEHCLLVAPIWKTTPIKDYQSYQTRPIKTNKLLKEAASSDNYWSQQYFSEIIHHHFPKLRETT